MNDATINTGEPVDINRHVHELLAKHRRIAAIWCTDDVRGVRPHLTDDQAWEVLQQVGRPPRRRVGHHWTTLETIADDLYPQYDNQRRQTMKLEIIDIASHRNGICGAPFHAVIFEDCGPEGAERSIVFAEPHHCAVLDIVKLAASDIAFGSNSWPGRSL